MDDHPLDVALRARTNAAFRAALKRCAEAGEVGDQALSRALPHLGRDRRVDVAVLLGDLRAGSAGVEALIRAVQAPDSSRDLRCSALLALAKRANEAASTHFAAGFASRDWAVKSYALIALAGHGDDRAWDDVRRYLDRKLAKRKSALGDAPWSVQRTPACWATCYLSRHLHGPASDVRTLELVNVLRRSGDALVDHWPDAQRWFEEFWPTALHPDAAAGEVAQPEVRELERWIRGDPLFAPVEVWKEPWP